MFQAKATFLQCMTALMCEPEDAVLMNDSVFEQLDESIQLIHEDAAINVESLKNAAREEASILLVEYARLFIGPFKVLAPPYASVYFGETQLNNEITDMVKAYYEKAGLIFEEASNDLPDHIAVETEFLQFLAAAASRDSEESRMAESVDFSELYLDFLKNHYQKWVPAFCNSVIKQTNSEFYKKLFSILGRVISAF